MPRMLKKNFKTGHGPRLLYLYILAFIIFVAFSSQAFALTLKDKAVVYEEQIYLKDIIVEADEEAAWGNIVVWYSPSPNTKRSIYKSFVVTLFRKNGYFAEAESLEGPNKVEILRASTQVNIDTQAIEAKSSTLDYDLLWGKVEEQLSFRLSDITPDGFMFLLTSEKEITQIPWPDKTIDVICDLSVIRDIAYGRLAIPVDAVLDSGQKKRLIVIVVIEYEGPVLISTKDYRPKEQLEEDSIIKEIRKVSTNPNNFFSPSKEISYYQSKSFIRSGDVLMQNQVEIRPVFFKGDITKLTYQSGAIYIEVLVELLEDAIPNKKVRVQNKQSGMEIVAFVTEDGDLVAFP